MRVTKKHVGTGALMAIVLGALALGAAYREVDSTSSEEAAERALAELDKRPAREALAERCKPDGGASEAVTSRACAALQELATLDNEPLAAATRLSELSRARAVTPHARSVVAEVQVMRVELLLTAGHSREAAHEAQLWAELHRTEPTPDAVRLWVAAARANRAIGDEDRAREDARHALLLAQRAKN